MDTERRTTLIRGAVAILAVVVFYAVFFIVWTAVLSNIYLTYSSLLRGERPWVDLALWAVLPYLVSSFLMVVIAALTFGRDRLRSRPGWLVVLTPPVLVLLVDLVVGVTRGDPWYVLIRFAAVAAGAGAAFWLVRPRERGHADLLD
ncbi:uncharacterized membrane protein YhaH (DUF805 family) [Lipingzhangella halophila]|uniref:Uncharacterized membrane protein YhaH (DUF805 family) n=1 Tax=Lipingzhangella halophila TaxID=1783352 RepID=A0A7W7RK42_9ACTN|nr:hypothetical protein [Lipingzhangella halophila]MBB4932981.1 uncharacterized membrane protein YhaH (DUF805 family) [Lipingzhangella halophila]